MKTSNEAGTNRLAAAMAGALAAATMAFFAGCGGGGGGGGPSGNSTIMGTVKSYKTVASVYLPSERVNGLAKVVGTIADLFVPQAQAAVAGVTVKIKGTDLSGTTASDGLFVISGVPAGTRTVVFEFNGDSVEIEVEVEKGSTVHLDGVKCDGGSSSSDDDGEVEIEHVHSEDHDADDDDDDSDDDDDDSDEDDHDNDPNHT